MFVGISLLPIRKFLQTYSFIPIFLFFLVSIMGTSYRNDAITFKLNYRIFKMKKLLLTAITSLVLFSQSLFAVNVNTADAVAIAEELKGIGVKKAQAIIDYRKTNGDFKTIESLTEVKGIGLKTVEKNRENIQLSAQ